MTLSTWEQRAKEMAQSYGGGQEKQEGDGSWMTLCPAHGDKKTPNLHLTAKKDRILAFCHTCGEANQTGVVSKIMEDGFVLHEKKDRKDVELTRKTMGGWIRPVPSTAPARISTCYIPVLRERRVPSAMWAYCNEAGEVLFYNARFNYLNEEGLAIKLYRRLAFYHNKDEDKPNGWAWFQPTGVTLPLYGLEKLKSGWEKKTVLLVEGEKTCEAAQKLLPECIVIAYSGGAGNYQKTDWTPITSSSIQSITIWPDNDDAGKNMAHGPLSVSQHLLKQNITCKVVNVFKEPDLPAKWDLADQIPDDWAPEKIRKLVEEAVPAAVLDQERVLDHCEVLRTRKFKSLDSFLKTARTMCNQLDDGSQTSPCHTCLQFNRIEQPSDIIHRPKLLLDWTYLSRQKVYYNLKTQEELDPTALNAIHAHLSEYAAVGKDGASNQFQLDPRSAKVYDYNYRPDKPVVFTNKIGQKRINKWPGYAIKPVYNVEPTPWLKLAHHLFKNESHVEHLFDWMAFLLQHPGLKINHGLLMISEVQGVGKDSLIQPLREILGTSNYSDIASNSLDSDFNEYLFANKLVIISELDTIGHRRSTYDKLKPLLASPPDTLEINIKNLRTMQIDNIVQMIAFSNKEVPIVIEGHDRRLFVLNVRLSYENKWAPVVFKKYYEWIKNGGHSEVFGWLLKRDVTNFNYGGDAPSTKDKTELALRGDSLMYHLSELFKDSLFPFDKDLVTSEEIYDVLKEAGFRRIIPSSARDAAKKFGWMKLVSRPSVNGKQARFWSCRRHDYWQFHDNINDVRDGYNKNVFDAGVKHKDVEPSQDNMPF